MIRKQLLLVLALFAALSASAEEINRTQAQETPRVSAEPLTRIALPPSQNPTNADLPFSAAVWAGDMLYVSGWLDPNIQSHPDTASQTVGLLKDAQKFLATQKLSFGDVVMMHVFLSPDPKKDGKADWLGARAGYAQFFGTKDQPNKPACTTVPLAAARGALIEIDFVAMRPR